MENNIKQPVAQKKSAGAKGAGLAGAWLGAFLGSIPMMIAPLAFRTLSLPLAALVPVVSQYFYRKLSGYRKRRTAIITITLISLAAILFARLLGEAFALSKDPAWKAAAAEYETGAFEFAWAAMLMTENFKLLIPGLLFCAAICVTSVFVCYPFIKEYADLSPEEETELKNIQKQENAEAARAAAKVVSEKRKNLPGRLENFASGNKAAKVDPKGEYRVAPESLQKKYLTAAAVIAIVLGVLLFAGCVYMTVKGSLQYVLFSLFCLALCVFAVRVLFSVSRWIDVDGKNVKARGMSGKVTEFSFDDVSGVERDDKRYYITGKNGEILAFFNISWQNARRLFTAMEGYGIVMAERVRDL